MKTIVAACLALLFMPGCSRQPKQNQPPVVTAAKEGQPPLVMYAPDGVLEEVPDSRLKFAIEAGFRPVMWFIPTGHTARAFPVPIDGTDVEMFKEGWKPLKQPLTANQARAEYWTVRPPRAQ